jgi:predicted DsbA family dithiol-disulfide isomerase
MKQIHITHYSDVLCVWAYVSQIRINELIENYGKSVELDFLFFSVFGNAVEKIDKGWENKGGRAAYSQHVQDVVSQFGHLPIHSDIWVKDAPYSSLPSHLYLCAAQLAEANGKLESGSFTELAWQMRKSFFEEAKDISNIEIIKGIIEEKGLSLSEFESSIANGKAYAALSKHMQSALDGQVRASPTLTFNEDRQRLTGNVGYRIIEANVRELLERPEVQQTWC